jgi:hypothetical protein
MTLITHIRVGNVIRELSTNTDTVFKSKNKAKQHVRLSLPAGAVRVYDKFPVQQ